MKLADLLNETLQDAVQAKTGDTEYARVFSITNRNGDWSCVIYLREGFEEPIKLPWIPAEIANLTVPDHTAGRLLNGLSSIHQPDQRNADHGLLQEPPTIEHLREEERTFNPLTMIRKGTMVFWRDSRDLHWVPDHYLSLGFGLDNLIPLFLEMPH